MNNLSNKNLSEKIQETIDNHFEEKKENELKLLFHMNSLKILIPGDKILVHSGFYHTCGYHEVHMITKDYIYLKAMDMIVRFSVYDGVILKIDDKPPQEKYIIDNYSVAKNSFLHTIKIPIWEIKYKENKTEKDIPSNKLCYSISDQTVCPHLTEDLSYYFICGLTKETLTDSFTAINSKFCMTKYGKEMINNNLKNRF